MNTNQASTQRSHPDGAPYALRREGGHWRLTFGGQVAIFKHELGALYVAYLLLESPRQALHAVALALKAREAAREPAAPDELAEQHQMGLQDASAVRALWRRQRELQRVLADRLQIEPVKAEAREELEAICETLRQSQWLQDQGAQRCSRAVSAAIQRFHARLREPADAQWDSLESWVLSPGSTAHSPQSTVLSPQGGPNPVLAEFADHLHRHLLVPSGRGCKGRFRWLAMVPSGCFIYIPPSNVLWEADRRSILEIVCSDSSVRPSSLSPRPRKLPAALGLLSRLLGMTFAFALLATGCAGPRPLKGGKATTARSQAGLVQQTLAQGENASQPTKQDQETIKVRNYTLPAATRIEQCDARLAAAAPARSADKNVRAPSRSQACGEPSTLNSQPSTLCEPSTTYVLSAPMPVVEREETRARTELGAAQKDTARDLAAKLSSLKGIVWVSVGLFIFGLASLVYPPLKAIVASVTTSVALMLGGVALIVLPTMVVGNELLILGGVALVVGAWFLAHRHGQLSGLVAASTASVAANSPRPNAAAQPNVQGAAK